jgi:hypothetical protein
MTPVYLQIAQLCIKSGVGTTLVSSWIEEGWRRAAAIRAMLRSVTPWREK